MKTLTNNKGYAYWSYILVYVENCLAVHHDSGPIMEDLESCYKLKNDINGEPERYLGANVEKYQLEHNGEKSYWSMHAYDYVVESCKMVQGCSEKDGRKFKNNREDTMKGNYCPKIDISDELGDNLATQYQQMIGILQCSVEH